MPSIELFKYWLPASTPKGKPYLSRWRMTAEEAAARGALRPEPSSREVRQVGARDVNGSFSHLGAAWTPASGDEQK